MIESKLRFVFVAMLMVAITPFLFAQASGSPYAEMVSITHDSGDGGSVEFSLTGSPGEYTYYWTHGPEELSLSGLAPGDYTLVVRDFLGCEQEFDITILNLAICEFSYQVVDGERACTAILQLTVTLGGQPVSASDLKVVWSDGNSDSDKRTVNTFTGGTFCATVSVLIPGNTCTNFSHCFVIAADPGCLEPQDDYELNFRVSDTPQNACLKNINTDIIKNGSVYTGGYTAKWTDNGVTSLDRQVYAETDYSYCLSVVIDDGPVLNDCTFVPGDPSCTMAEECDLFLSYTTDEDDPCRKIIKAEVLQNGIACEEDYTIEWPQACTPEVEIVENEGPVSYKLDFVNPEDESSEYINLSVEPNSSVITISAKARITENDHVISESIQYNREASAGISTIASSLSDGEGYLDSIKVNDTNGNSFYIPLSPSEATLSGIGSAVNPTDLIFDTSNTEGMKTALIKVINNFLFSKGYIEGQQYNVGVTINSMFGTIYIYFGAKHLPSGVWVGIKRGDSHLSYHRDINTTRSYISTGVVPVGFGNSNLGYSRAVEAEYPTSCGVIRNKAYPEEFILFDPNTNFNYVDFAEPRIMKKSNLYHEITCPSSIITAVPKNCNGPATYLWDNGVTTQSIPDDGLTHTVEVQCDCEILPVPDNQTFERVIYAYEDREHCISVTSADGTESYEECIFIPAEPGCEEPVCEVDFLVDVNPDDPCEKLVTARVAKAGFECEGNYTPEWLPTCEPMVEIGEIVDSAFYSLELVNPIDSTSKTLRINEPNANDLNLTVSGRYVLKNKSGRIIDDEYVTSSEFRLYKFLRINNYFGEELVNGSYIDSVKVYSSEGTYFFIPLSPEKAYLTGVGGIVNQQDLIFDSSSPTTLRDAISKVMTNFLYIKGYEQGNNYLIGTSVFDNGSVVFQFQAKHNPTVPWIGPKSGESEIYYTQDEGSSLISKSLTTGISGATTFTSKQFGTDCGNLSMSVNYSTQLKIMGFEFDDFLSYGDRTNYQINSSNSALTQACSLPHYIASPQDCNGPATYLWDTGDTTQTIINDGQPHTVEVDCNCESEPLPTTLQRIVYAYQDTTLCVNLYNADSTEIYEGCVFIPAEPGCTEPVCELEFIVDTNPLDSCEKTISAAVSRNGVPCEGEYITEWITPCIPEATVETEADTTVYTMQVVHPTDTSSQDLELFIDPNVSGFKAQGRFIVKDDKGQKYLDQLSWGVAKPYLYMTANLGAKGWLDDILLYKSTGGTITVPLSPSTADRGGPGGSVNSNDLKFDAANRYKLRDALRKVIINYLANFGYSQYTNYEITVSVWTSGRVDIGFYAKHQPNRTWIGIKDGAGLLNYHWREWYSWMEFYDYYPPEEEYLRTSTYVSSYTQRFTVYGPTYNTPCGNVRLNLGQNNPPDQIVDILDFDQITFVSDRTDDYYIRSNSTISQTCTGDGVLRAVPQNCIDNITYLWDTGETTETITNDGLEHTVTVDCNCSGEISEQVPTQTVFTFEDAEYCVRVTNASDSTDVYEDCFLLPAQEGCEEGVCDLKIELAANPQDTCEKILTAVVDKNDRPCEEEYEAEWIIPCTPEATIVSNTGQDNYSIEFNSGGSSLIIFPPAANDTYISWGGSFTVRKNNSTISSEYLTGKSYLKYGMKTTNTRPLYDGGYLRFLKLLLPSGGYTYIYFEPTRFTASGPGGTVNQSDLYFYSDDPERFKTALTSAVINALHVKGYTQGENYEVEVRAEANGTVGIFFTVKHQPTTDWVNIYTASPRLYYKYNPTTYAVSTSYETDISGTSLDYQYNTPCGPISLYVNPYYPFGIDISSSSTSTIATENNVIVSTDDSAASRNCSFNVLQAIPQNCNGPATYLWDTGATTSTIPDDGASHEVTIDCDCEEVIVPGFEYTASESGTYCVKATSTGPSGNVFEDCYTLDIAPGCITPPAPMLANGSPDQVEETRVIESEVEPVEQSIKNTLDVYPNPFQDYLHINFASDQSGIAELYFYTTSGQLIHKQKIEGESGANSYKMDFNNLASGPLFLQFVFPSGERMSRRVIHVDQR